MDGSSTVRSRVGNAREQARRRSRQGAKEQARDNGKRPRLLCCHSTLLRELQSECHRSSYISTRQSRHRTQSGRIGREKIVTQLNIHPGNVRGEFRPLLVEPCLAIRLSVRGTVEIQHARNGTIFTHRRIHAHRGRCIYLLLTILTALSLFFRQGRRVQSRFELLRIAERRSLIHRPSLHLLERSSCRGL